STDLGRGFTNLVPDRPISVAAATNFVARRPFIGRNATNFVDHPTEIGRSGTNFVDPRPRSVDPALILWIPTDPGQGKPRVAPSWPRQGRGEIGFQAVSRASAAHT